MEECNYKAAPSEPFEFPSSSSSSSSASMMICIAGDIISGGKLLPFCAPPADDPARINGKVAQRVVVAADDSLQLVGSRGVSARGYRKLRKDDQDRNPVRRRKARRWYVLAFGFPSLMELKDIRNRILFRHQQYKSTPLPAMEVKETKKKKNKEQYWGPWKLLRSLTCM